MEKKTSCTLKYILLKKTDEYNHKSQERKMNKDNGNKTIQTFIIM